MPDPHNCRLTVPSRGSTVPGMSRNEVRDLLSYLREKPAAGAKMSVAIPAEIVAKAHRLNVPLNSSTIQAGLILLLGSVEKQAVAADA